MCTQTCPVEDGGTTSCREIETFCGHARRNTTIRPGDRATVAAVLDDIDRRIVAALVDDGRISINELAARVNVSRATAYARFERLRSAGVITGFRAEVD